MENKDKQNPNLADQNIKENLTMGDKFEKNPFNIPLISYMKKVYEDYDQYSYKNHDKWILEF